ncbi:MAG TPA: TIGR01777 family oxidoreductase [Ramlibacter sp.]|nr:TIGR01777 family oxidoreductase [Ramlibacter sp.]
MNAVFSILFVQAPPGAFDNFWHHEIGARFSLFGLGVLAWSARNFAAVRRLQAPAATAPQPAGRHAGPAILVTGATGFIGSALVKQLLAEGRRVIVCSRDILQARRSFPGAWVVDRLDDIPGETRIDAVVHLAGAATLGAPWTRRRRELLVGSRTGLMQQLLALMRRLDQPPRVLVGASAVGFYGVPEGRDPLDETAPPQPGRFQSDLCAAVEHEARRAEALGVRVVRLRLGIVLGAQGGAYPALALSSRLGLGARLGSGQQPVPWIHIDDAVGLLRFAIEQQTLSGAVNAVAPELASQTTFAREMAAAFGRKVVLRVPGWALQAALGEMSELLRCGQWAVPTAALAAGYRFRQRSLRGAMAALAGGRL